MNQNLFHPKLSVDKHEAKAFFWFHVGFSILNGVILFGLSSWPVGWRIFSLVLIYNVGTAIWTYWKGYALWKSLWQFLLPLSIFQVFPDWFLSAELNILVFPEDGFYKIGTVSAYMAGLWVIPLTLSIYLGEWFKPRGGTVGAYILVALTAVLIFGISEETMWVLPSWHAQNVALISHTAIYVLIPELILGISAFYAFQELKMASWLAKIVGAFFVMLVYTGALMFFYFMIEKVL